MKNKSEEHSVTLSTKQIEALIAAGQNCFIPASIDDDHDEALVILSKAIGITPDVVGAEKDGDERQPVLEMLRDKKK